AAALRADQPPSPFRHCRLGAIPSSLLNRIGLAAVTAPLAPHQKPEAGGGPPQRHRGAAGGVQPTLAKGFCWCSRRKSGGERPEKHRPPGTLHAGHRREPIMGIERPYRRTVRPHFLHPGHPWNSAYVRHPKFALEPEMYVRGFRLLQKDL